MNCISLSVISDYLVVQEIRPWTHMMEVPQLHGFGPAANRLLEAYKMLLKVPQCRFTYVDPTWSFIIETPLEQNK